MMMDEARLIEKLRLIEALFSGAKTEGEKHAADRARQRILERLKTTEQAAPPVEFKFTMHDRWQQKVFMALLRRYGIKPYRFADSATLRLWRESRKGSSTRRSGPSSWNCPKLFAITCLMLPSGSSRR
jgi:hypothetical protein